MGVARGMDNKALRILGDVLVVLLLVAALGYVAHIDATVRLAQSFGGQLVAEGVTPAPELHETLAAPAPEAAPAPAPEDPVLAAQRAQYDAVVVKTALELQQFRRSQSVPVSNAAGRQGLVALSNINPRVNVWHVLAFDWGRDRPRAHYHLENPFRRAQTLQLSELDGGALVLVAGGKSTRCDLWTGVKPALDAARASKLPYAPLCGGRIFLRNRVQGHYTDLEQMTDFLRENIYNGDDIVGFVRQTVYQDAFKEQGKSESVKGAAADTGAPLRRAALKASATSLAVVPESLGLNVEGTTSRSFMLGQWYPVRNAAGTFASVIRPGAVSDDIAVRDKASLNPLDEVEASALAYLVAFDLGLYEMRFALGTDHPRLNWSARVPGSTIVGSLPGPDGVSSTEPLVTTGMVGPTSPGRIVATFSGGFKREHGAFKWGDLSKDNFGSHYGFVESGAVLSKLQPGLATLYTLDDGSFGMKTWREADNALLSRVAYARQNGVALVEPGADGQPTTGSLVNRWGPGNWSGSADAKLRTLRGGACLIRSGEKQYLVYGYFSTATPSAMAVVFRAYGCSYALNLDMNALEHTYLALYARQGDTMQVQHLVRGMANVDKNVKGKLVPRFMGYPDNRDLFYLVKRSGTP